jgi:hypothetical protein
MKSKKARKKTKALKNKKKERKKSLYMKTNFVPALTHQSPSPRQPASALGDGVLNLILRWI